ncbi:MAG: hypothetical protein ACOX6E_00865 [Syntrophomonadaceae bacterium]|jgi:hypothetical protein
MIIFIENWKKKLVKTVLALVVIGIFFCILPILTGLLNNQIPVVGPWQQDKQPSGNPMRVEQNNENKFNLMLDQFVIKIQDFYYED